jgi:hypothetical protein
MGTCLSALTPAQTEVLAKLKAKYGKGVKVEFYNSNSTILRSMWFEIKYTKYRGEKTYISAANSIIKELEPYLQSRTVEMNPAQCKFNEVTYSQKKFGDFNFEEQSAILRICLRNTYVLIGNTLIYDFQLPKPPYISKDRALEIADSTYWKYLGRDTNQIKMNDVGPGFEFIEYKIKKFSDLKAYRQEDILLICMGIKSNGDIFYRLAYKVTYSQGYVVKICAKTGEAIFHQDTIIY